MLADAEFRAEAERLRLPLAPKSGEEMQKLVAAMFAISPEGKAMIIDTDLVVVGGGIAGLTAANRAAALGCRVVVLEKGEDEGYPCNSRIATGVLNVAHSDPHSDPALLRQAIEADTEGYAEP